MARATTSTRGRRHHAEDHVGPRAQRLRAGVLGANDGLLSTAGLLVGVASAAAGRPILAATGAAALVAGAASMAVGEYSSVSSQRDAEHADLAVEADELESMPHAELAELTSIYVHRGLPHDLAHEVASTLTEHDALGTHARDELGLDLDRLAQPTEASITSALSFAAGALVPIAVVLVTSGWLRVPAVVFSTLVGLAGLGALGARLGGAPPVRPAFRVLVGGVLALAASWAIGTLFHVSTG